MRPNPAGAPAPPRPDRRRFLAAGLAGGLAAAAGADDPPFELAERTIADLQAGLRVGKYPARALAEQYLARIEAVDRRGPALRSVIELNPDALALADALDRESRGRGPRGPLH